MYKENISLKGQGRNRTKNVTYKGKAISLPMALILSSIFLALFSFASVLALPNDAGNTIDFTYSQPSTNYSNVNVNNSQYLQGLIPSQVANLFTSVYLYNQSQSLLNQFGNLWYNYSLFDQVGTTISPIQNYGIPYANATGSIITSNGTLLYTGLKFGVNVDIKNATTFLIKGRPSFVASGTVSYVNTAKVIIGSGTNFTKEVGVGDYVCNDGAGCSSEDRVISVINDTELRISLNNFQPSGNGLTMRIKPAIANFQTQAGNAVISGTGDVGYNGIYVDYYGNAFMAGDLALNNLKVIKWPSSVNGAIQSDIILLQTTGGSNHLKCQDDGTTRTCRVYPNQVNLPSRLMIGWDAAGANPYPSYFQGGEAGGAPNRTANMVVYSGGVCRDYSAGCTSNGIAPTYGNAVIGSGQRASTSNVLNTITPRLWFDNTQNGYVNSSITFVNPFNLTGIGNLGIGTKTANYPLTVIGNDSSGISIWADGNISASGYITRTDVYDSSKLGKTAVSELKDSSKLLNPDGTVNHTAFGYSAVSYKNQKKIGETSYTIQNEVCADKPTSKINITTGLNLTEPICHFEPYVYTTPIYEEYTEQGVDLVKEVSMLRQSLYEVTNALCISDKGKLYPTICKMDGTIK